MVALVGLDFHPLNLLIGEASLSCSSSSDDDNVETVVSNSTTKSSVFDSVCDELLFEILQRLPLKEIHLCKCLSKRWFVLLSSTRFITQCYGRYHQTLVDPSSFALFYQYRHKKYGIIFPEHMGVHLMTLSNSALFKSPGFSLSFLPNNPKEPIRILAVSNGLVLCCATFMFQSQYYVCNPLTKHWVALPPPPTSDCKKFVRIGFICRTTTTLYSENFSTSGSFRVVRVRDYELSTSSAAIRLELFSSETWQWTEIVPSKFIRRRELRKSLFCPLHSNAIVCNGILHWHSFLGKIFAYDVYKSDDGCCHRIISLPKDRNTQAHDFYFGETQGRLRYIESVYSTVRMWSVEDYNKGEWCLLKKFHIDQMVSEDPRLNLRNRSLQPIRGSKYSTPSGYYARLIPIPFEQ